MNQNKMKIGYQVSLILTLMLVSFISQAKDFNHKKLWSFENIINSQWGLSKGQKLEISPAHFKHGKNSIKWNWKKEGDITLKHDIGFEPFNSEGEDKSIPSFAIWIYNEEPVDKHITFVFGTGDTDNCQFNFNINYKGWRAAWVSFERDMEGEPVASMNRVRIETPKGMKKGQLYFDHMFLCQNIDSRHHTPDLQVPMVNSKTTNNWLQQYNASIAQPDLSLPVSLTVENKEQMATIADRFEADILKKTKVNQTLLNNLEDRFEHYKIKRSGNQITGLPVWFGRNAELYIPYISRTEAKKFFNQDKQNVKSYFDLMFQVASAYANTDNGEWQQSLQKMFIDLFDHMVDQGFAAGSGLGTIHHYGYAWRNYYRALFIMRHVLAANGRLDEAVDGMQWFAALGEVFHKPKKYGMDMDAFNTVVMGRLASIIIMDDSPKKVQYLNCFARWINNGLMPAPGLDDSFKIDGSSYHHANNYPAYATGGMRGAVRMVYFLSQTDFRVSAPAHANLKKALMTMRFYCNLLHWPTSMSGRHPEGKGKLIPEHFAILAKAGSVDSNSKIDKELAAAYLRLVRNQKDKYTKELSQFAKAENAPQGHITMPYASVSVQRRANWSASVRGHSRYLWASEQYLAANMYGRYLGHGQLQIMGGNNPVTPKSSGFVQQGWDWNRFPGTTVINLPLDELRADIRNVDRFSGYEEMLFSDEAFAGGVGDKKDGVYAFKLHEHDKYQGSLRARKSYFFFNNRIICLGSDIENNNGVRDTETIIFQNHMGEEDLHLTINGALLNDSVTNFNADKTWVLDNKGNGYYLPSGKIYIRQGEQNSRDESSEKPTKGQFTVAVFEHGYAPQNETYEYCVWPGVGELQQAPQQGYTVLSQNKAKHIVKDEICNQIGYVFFEAAENNNIGAIESTNIPCLIMSKATSNGLNLHVVNPDLAIYEGAADEIYKDGKRVERSIYSRPWRSDESKVTVLKLQVKGAWVTKRKDIESSVVNGTTTLIIKCKDGLTEKIELIAL